MIKFLPPIYALGCDLNLTRYVVNIEEESEVYRTSAPKTVHILFTTIITCGLLNNIVTSIIDTTIV